MQKLGTFFDDETGAEYDLYTINALTIKKAIDKSYNLTELKLRMFNGSEHVMDEIRHAADKYKLEFDWEKGKVINLKTFKANKKIYGKAKDIILNNANHKQDKAENPRYETQQCFQQLGFELLPIAISLKDRNVNDMKKIELIDGFKRMFFTEVPDKDIFVKVYDILDNVQWFNAMLLFNSWKLFGSTELFIDRGFKLGLYKHFNLDLTLPHFYSYYINALKYIYKYMEVDVYKVFHNNQYAIDDIKLILDGYEAFTGNQVAFLAELVRMLGSIRTMEYDNRQKAKKFVISDFINFRNRKDMIKHFKKIDKMQVTGFIENHVRKYMAPLMINYVRSEYGLPEKENIKPYSYDYNYCNFFEELKTQEK